MHMIPSYLSNIIEWPAVLWLLDLGLPGVRIRTLWGWPELLTSQATLGWN